MTSENTAPVSEGGEWVTELREAVERLRELADQVAALNDPDGYVGRLQANLAKNANAKLIKIVCDAALAASPAPPPLSDVVEEIARIIDPHAFKARASFYEYCVKHGDSEEWASSAAEETHGPDCEKALAKARQIAALQGTAEEGKEGGLGHAGMNGPGSTGKPEARLVCPECGGDGCFDREPYPTPNGPRFPEPQTCGRCGGSGEVPAEDAPAVGERGCGHIDCLYRCGGDYTWETCPKSVTALGRGEPS